MVIALPIYSDDFRCSLFAAKRFRDARSLQTSQRIKPKFMDNLLNFLDSEEPRAVRVKILLAVILFFLSCHINYLFQNP